ncbi:MAG TPA: GreA/GreB family elongation factor [Alphaproteobacteria bacterium]|nr:GreA/GreB family elongation factor [Alphaproteobacteria bacterium]
MSARHIACTNCPALVPADLTRCQTCDEPVFAAVAEMPVVYITTAQYGRIENHAHIGLPPEHPAGRMLIEKLEKSVVCRPGGVPADAVTMNSRVIFRVDGAAAETRLLVYPEQYFPTGQYLSLATPLGAALLGLREGDQIRFTDLQGTQHTVIVEKVAYQPEGKELAVDDEVSRWN